MSLPLLPIIFLTYGANKDRSWYAHLTVRSNMRHLKYDGELLWMIVDDGDYGSDHWNMITALADPMAYLSFCSNRAGYGANANRAWANARSLSPVSFWLEDDWELQEETNITPYVETLLNHDSVGMVRLGNMPANLNLRSEGYDGRVYLEVLQGTQYAFSGNPHLKHSRFHTVYGDYPEGHFPGDTEVQYDHQISKIVGGPSIVRPLDLGTWGPWGHIGTVQSYET